jgi:hypothetical protein
MSFEFYLLSCHLYFPCPLFADHNVHISISEFKLFFLITTLLTKE